MKNYQMKLKKKFKSATGIFSSAGPIAVTRLEREKEMGIKSSKSMEAEHPIVQTVEWKKTFICFSWTPYKIKKC